MPQLITECYRYVEIATYSPLGAMVGLGLMSLYVLVFVLRQFANETATVSPSADEGMLERYRVG